MNELMLMRRQAGVNRGISIYELIKNYMYSSSPSNSPSNDESCVLYNFGVGKTYKIIIKLKNASNDAVNVYVYKGSANTPNYLVSSIPRGETIKEFTYTHTQSETYTRLGLWVLDSNYRNGKSSAVVYIEEI